MEDVAKDESEEELIDKDEEDTMLSNGKEEGKAEDELEGELDEKKDELNEEEIEQEIEQDETEEIHDNDDNEAIQGLKISVIDEF